MRDGVVGGSAVRRLVVVAVAALLPVAIAGAQALPDGRLLLETFTTAASPGRHYDIVDRRGVLAGRVALADNERIVGFGAASVYVAVTDDDGIQRLRCGAIAKGAAVRWTGPRRDPNSEDSVNVWSRVP